MSEDKATTPEATGSSDPVAVKLNEFGADETVAAKVTELGVSTLEDLALLTEQDLVSAGVKIVQARKLLASLKPVTPVAETAALGAVAFEGVLPNVPDDGSWLEALKTGGVLKVEKSTVISAIRAALGNRVGLFEVPAKLVDAMEKYSDSIDEPVAPSYFKLREQLTRKSYGDIFAAIPGLTGNYVSESRKKDLFLRVNQHLWPAIWSFNQQLKNWMDAWMQQGASPVAMMSVFASSMGGGGGFTMPPGMLQPPETSVLRDHADAVADAINKVFAGTGVQIAAALAYEASQIKATLEDSNLPGMIGAANRDQMLKQLGVNVSSTYPRMETNVTRYVLGIMEVKDQPAGNEELQYFGALNLLGSQIPWDQLGAGSTGMTGVGGNRL